MKFNDSFAKKTMKNLSLFIALLVFLLISNACKNKNMRSENGDNKSLDYFFVDVDTTDFTNDFYDNSKAYALKTSSIEVTGEIKNPGKVNFEKLPFHSVIVKESLLENGNIKFIGAFRYYGYSLYDILNLYHLNKKNEKEFPPITDLYVEIGNNKGEKTIISWGEIYYPNHLNEIIIATKVMRITPSKSKELWKLPVDSKIVVASDLISERNVSNPVRITVKSYDIDLNIEKGKSPLFSPKTKIYVDNNLIETLYNNPDTLPELSLQTIFYGRGLGLHWTKPFKGVRLKDILENFVKKSPKTLQQGIFVVAADDGYRAVFSYSEICNRNDQEEVLLICNPRLKNDGIFRIFPSCDFFSDRAVKGINAVYYSE